MITEADFGAEIEDMTKAGFRTERDSMGELEVPIDALWAAQTQRAVVNFPISGRPMPRAFIRAVALVESEGGVGMRLPRPRHDGGREVDPHAAARLERGQHLAAAASPAPDKK